MRPVTRISSITGTTFGRSVNAVAGPGRNAGAEAVAPAASLPTGRALIALTPASERSRRPDGRAVAGFLAHLIATRGGLPQTRERRRADPAEVQTAYRAVASTAAASAPSTLRVV